MLPAFLLIVMIGLDFGRFFQGWVHIQQAARVGANYASTHSKDLEDVSKHDATIAAMTALVTSDASTSDCSDTPAVSEPVFLTTADTGRALDSVKVTVQCTFTLASPLGALIQLAAGNGSQSPTLQVGADSVFPVRDLYASDIPDAQGGTPVPPPTASWYSQCFPSSGNYPLAVSCQGGWTGSAASWSWSWGDGGTATGCQNIGAPTDGYCTASHTYTSAGTFSATFTVTNGSGSSSISKTITVTAPAPDPVAKITCVSPTTCSSTSGSVVVTLSSSTSTTTYPPMTCSWTGLGTTVSGCGTQSWLVSGTCTASLTVTNANNSSDTTTKTITVGNPPSASCTATPIGGPTPTPGPTATATPIPYCIVPSFIGDTFTKNNWNDGTHIVHKWTVAGFTAGNISPSPAFSGSSPNSTRTVMTQSLGAGNSVVCSSTMTFTYSPSP